MAGAFPPLHPGCSLDLLQGQHNGIWNLLSLQSWKRPSPSSLCCIPCLQDSMSCLCLSLFPYFVGEHLPVAFQEVHVIKNFGDLAQLELAYLSPTSTSMICLIVFLNRIIIGNNFSFLILKHCPTVLSSVTGFENSSAKSDFLSFVCDLFFHQGTFTMFSVTPVFWKFTLLYLGVGLLSLIIPDAVGPLPV